MVEVSQLHPLSCPLHSVLTREENPVGGKKTVAAHPTKKTLLHLEPQQLPTDKGKKVESDMQPGLSAIARSQAILFGARVRLSSPLGPTLILNTVLEQLMGYSTGKHKRPQSILFMHM